MSTSVEPNNSEFTQLVNDANAAMSTLANGIKEQNRVYLEFCQALVNNTIDAMTKLSSLDISIAEKGAAVKKELEEATKAANDNVASAGATAATQLTGNEPAAKAEADLTKETSDLASGFTQSVVISMANAVSAQQQQYVVAQATTVQTITNIISLTTASLASAVKNIERN